MNNTSAILGTILDWTANVEKKQIIIDAFPTKGPADPITINEILTNTNIDVFDRLWIVIRDYFFIDKEMINLLIYYSQDILSYFKVKYPINKEPANLLDFLETASDVTIAPRIENDIKTVSDLRFFLRQLERTPENCDAEFAIGTIRGITKLYRNYLSDQNYNLSGNILACIAEYKQCIENEKIDLIQLTIDYVATL